MRDMQPPTSAMAAISGVGKKDFDDRQTSRSVSCTQLVFTQIAVVLPLTSFPLTAREEQKGVELLTLLLLDDAIVPVFRIFSSPQTALLTSMASLQPALLRKPNSDSMGSLENFLGSTNRKLCSFKRNRMHCTLETSEN